MATFKYQTRTKTNVRWGKFHLTRDAARKVYVEFSLTKLVISFVKWIVSLFIPYSSNALKYS